MWLSLALTASRRIGHQCNVCWLHILSSAWYCRVFRTFEFVCTPSACIRPVSPNVLHPLCFAEFVVESSMPKAVNNYTDQLYVHRVITSFECSSCSSRLIVPHFFPPCWWNNCNAIQCKDDSGHMERCVFSSNIHWNRPQTSFEMQQRTVDM